MMDWLVYVVGYPGSGKTTAVRGALHEVNGEKPIRVERKPFAHTIYPSGLVELGCEKDIYGGTDALPLNVQPKVVKWMKDVDIPVIVAEGDRLDNRKFFNEACGYNETFPDELQCDDRYLCFVHIKCPELTARTRAWERGSRFNESWLKGRISKVDSLVRAASKPYIYHHEGMYNTPSFKDWKTPVDLTMNVFSTMDGEFHEIDGTQPPDDIALELRTIIGGLNDG